jgi:hypothetical protein
MQEARQMKHSNKILLGIGIVTLLALGFVASVWFITPIYAQGPWQGGNGNDYGGYGGMMSGMMGGGMMRGYGWAPSQAITPTVPYGGWHGMPWGGFGGMMGGGMMRGYGFNPAPNAKALSLDDAVSRAQQYAAAFGNSDLQLDEVEEYAWNFYGVVKEKSTGTGAFQFIIDKYTGAVYPEMGPNMMWNLKYAPMAGMMGSLYSTAPGAMSVSEAQARANAEQFLQANLPGVTVEEKADKFYGYYNFDALKDGKTYGMLSVNGYTGAVWYHTWHGDWIATKEME